MKLTQEQVEQFDELREDEHFVSFIHQRLELFEQRLGFGAGHVRFFVHEPRVTADLPQPQ